jgi:hypothetical protein
MEYEGALYHVTARGDHQNPIYKDDEDRRAFLRFSGCGRAVRWTLSLKHAVILVTCSNLKAIFFLSPLPHRIYTQTDTTPWCCDKRCCDPLTSDLLPEYSRRIFMTT